MTVNYTKKRQEKGNLSCCNIASQLFGGLLKLYIKQIKDHFEKEVDFDLILPVIPDDGSE